MITEDYVNDDFASINTLNKKEINLLNDLRKAHKNQDLNKFKDLIVRTGFKRVAESNKKQFWNFSTSRNILFERDVDFSLFETILKSPVNGNGKFISLLWLEGELWLNNEIILTKNPQGKLPIHYIIESNKLINLLRFLVFDYSEPIDVLINENKRYYLKLKNEQYTSITGCSLFGKLSSIINDNNHDNCMKIMEMFLIEIGEITDIEKETSIEQVMLMENEVFKDEILKLMVTFWQVNSTDYNHYKKVLVDQSIYLKLFITLKEHNQNNFEKVFGEYVEEMKVKVNCLKSVQDDCDSLLAYAVKSEQKHAIDLIITCFLFDVNKIIISSNGLTGGNDCISYLMLKLLENEYYMGNNGENQLPLDWMSADVFENYLNSKIAADSYNILKINYDFLIDTAIRNIELKSHEDKNGKLLFSSGMKALENILRNERLKNLITHPVLSTFINLKSKKYQLFVNLNFYIFLFGYLLPYFLLAIFFALESNEIKLFLLNVASTFRFDDKNGLFLRILLQTIVGFCILSTAFLTAREFVQLIWICESKTTYFKKRSNQLQLFLIFLSLFQLYGIKFKDIVEDRDNFKTFIMFPSALIIVFGTIELLTLLPYPSMGIYMTMLQEVSKTFVKFFTIFIFIIIAFTFSFCVAFNTSNQIDDLRISYKNNLNSYLSTKNKSYIAILEELKLKAEKTDEASNDFKNFDDPWTSFIKTLQLLTGSHLNPYDLGSMPKIFLYFIFILISFVLFNLINGLAISDIQSLREKAEYLILKNQIRNAAECEGVILQLFKILRRKTQNTEDISHGNWSRFVKYLLSFMIRKYPYLHKMDNLCIDLKHNKIYHEINEKLVPILKTHTGHFSVYMLSDEVMVNFQKIIKMKCNEKENNIKCVQTLMKQKITESKDEIRSNMNLLHDEMKSKIKLSNEEIKLLHDEMKSNIKLSNDEIKSNMKTLNEANARLERQNQELKELILKSLLVHKEVQVEK